MEIINNIPIELIIFIGLCIGGIIGTIDANMMSKNIDKQLQRNKLKNEKFQY
jgi:hypothetical protein